MLSLQRVEGLCLRVHGGGAPRGALDFSAPVSPLGPPGALVEAVEEAVRERVYVGYPSHGYEGLRLAIASFHSVDPGRVVVLNGAAELLPLLIPVYRPEKLVVVEPTFGDYVQACRAAGVRVEGVPLEEVGDAYLFPLGELLSRPASYYRGAIILFSNPNNPTGSLASRRDVERLLSHLPDDALVVVDEAFIDFSPGETLLGVDDPRLVVLRSYTKIFAVPGLRLGFAYFGDRGLAVRVDCYRQPWNVNAVAAAAFTRFLGERAGEAASYIAEARAVVERERALLGGQLAGLGVKVYRSQAPFLLLHHPGYSHPALQRALLAHGVYVRDASSFKHLTPSHTRVSVRLHHENMVLVEAFRRVLRGERVEGVPGPTSVSDEAPSGSPRRGAGG